MSQTKLPQDPEGGQCYPICSPQPQLGMESWWGRSAQERNGSSCAGVRQHPTEAAIRSFALDQRVQESMLRKTLDNKATAPACPALGEC